MLKIAVFIFSVIACAVAKPGLIGASLAYTVPAAGVVAVAPVATATSSQYIARNHNGIATAPVVAPVDGPVFNTYSAPVVAKYAAAYTTPFGYSTPLTYSAPIAANPLAYSAPLNFAAPASVLL